MPLGTLRRMARDVKASFALQWFPASQGSRQQGGKPMAMERLRRGRLAAAAAHHSQNKVPHLWRLKSAQPKVPNT